MSRLYPCRFSSGSKDSKPFKYPLFTGTLGDYNGAYNGYIWYLIKIAVPKATILESNDLCIPSNHVGDCQNCGPFLGPYYNTGPYTGPNLGDPKRDHHFDNPPKP